MKEIITRPFRTATPDWAMKPTAAEIENGMPRIQRKKTPPVKANGTPVKVGLKHSRLLGTSLPGKGGEGGVVEERQSKSVAERNAAGRVPRLLDRRRR